MPSPKSLIDAAANLWGVLQQPKYDAIVVGAGAAGCVIAQTLVDGGLEVLLVERGDERNEDLFNIRTQDLAFRDECVEKFSSKGVILGTGNCMGGASSWNLGVWIEETPEWVQGIVDPSEQWFTNDQVQAAYNWTREAFAPEPTIDAPGEPNAKIYTDALIDVYNNRPDFNVGNTDPGQPNIDPDGVWRIHSIFKNDTRVRRSADTLLERDNPRLTIRTKTEVKRILYDGDLGVPITVNQPRGDTPRARCVRFTSLEVVCVKDEGRIFLSAGAIHTPELLMKNGIGPKGKRVDNPEVGQNVNDKPVVLFYANWQNNFTITESVTLSHITATKQFQPSNGADNKTLVFAEFSYGIPGEPDPNRSVVLNLIQLVRSTIPTSARTGWVGDLLFTILDLCQRKIEDPGIFGLGPICKEINKLVEAGCDNNAFGMEMFMGSPTSRGSITLDTQGKIIVDVNFLDTEDDLEAWGHGTRTNFQILNSIMGPSRAQQPCEDSGNCPANNCPRILADFYDLNKATLDILKPKSGAKMISAPPSAIFPNNVEKLIKEGKTDIEIGNLLREDVYSGQHFVGSASIGKVVDNCFKVKGVDGLMIADGSVLTQTPRANPMAVIMMMARLAGAKYLQELGIAPVPDMN